MDNKFMFIQKATHSNLDKEIKLTFLRSLNVKAYPCGRRRSVEQREIQGTNNNYFIPFDPEARLNTEFNNRKALSTNGFSENFIGTWSAEDSVKICWDGTVTEIYKMLGSNTFYKVSEPIDTITNGIVCVSESGEDIEYILSSKDDVQVTNNVEYTDYIINVKTDGSSFEYTTGATVTFEHAGLYFFRSDDSQVSSFTVNYENVFSFAIGGYTFVIDLYDPSTKTNITDVSVLADKILQSLEAPTGCQKIYANIKLEKIPLYQKTGDEAKYSTWVLRNQSGTALAATALDMLFTDKTDIEDITKATNYYFSGLSFSTEPITGQVEDPDTGAFLTNSTKFIPSKLTQTGEYTNAQQEYSLCIFTNNGSSWQLYEPAKLPRVEHGETDDSIEVGHLNAKSLSYNNRPVAVFDISPTETDNTYKLSLFKAIANDVDSTPPKN